MPVFVCDAIMGSGKSSAAINYINRHPEKKFIYITPYLEEASRIKVGCPDAHFAEPKPLSEFRGSKVIHTADLIRHGKNVTTTHQAFIGYTPEMAEIIFDNGYTLIIDECISVLEPEGTGMTPDDFGMLEAYGILKRDGDAYHLTGKPYTGSRYRDIIQQIRTKELVIDEPDTIDAFKTTNYFYWFLSPNILNAFSEVFILTYMFKGQGLKAFLDIYGIGYQMIYISRRGGEYRFSFTDTYIPPYVFSLGDMITVCEDDRMNQVGDNRYAVSKSWFEGGQHKDDVTQLKKNVYNYFRSSRYFGSLPAEQKLWGSFKSGKAALTGRGYAKRFETFNCRATNKWKESICLVYAANVFMNVGMKHFYNIHGADISDDDYALSVMIQWIWRSAIRDGKHIDIYIPSRRMRGLLNGWIKNVTAQEEY